MPTKDFVAPTFLDGEKNVSTFGEEDEKPGAIEILATPGAHHATMIKDSETTPPSGAVPVEEEEQAADSPQPDKEVVDILLEKERVLERDAVQKHGFSNSSLREKQVVQRYVLNDPSLPSAVQSSEDSVAQKLRQANNDPNSEESPQVVQSRYGSFPGAVPVVGPNHVSTDDEADDNALDAMENAQPEPSSVAPPPERSTSDAFEPENPVQATLVSGNADEVVEAQPMTESTNKEEVEEVIRRKNRVMRYGMMAACLAIVVVGLVVGLVVNNNNKNNKQDQSNSNNLGDSNDTAAPTFKEYLPFAPENMLPMAMDLIEEFPSSPSALANAWSWEDPHRSNYSIERQLFRYGLVTLYYSMQGDNWDNNDNWLDYEVPECEWYSSQPEGACRDGEWYATNLSHNSLQGTLPFEMFHMVHFHTIVDLHSNKMHGILPPMRGGGKMAYLDISDNELEGEVTMEVAWSNDQLWYFNVSGNYITGILPTYYIGAMPNLETFDVSDNGFFGTIRDTFDVEATQSNLRVLNFGGNKLEGTLPPSLMTLIPNLEKLDVSNIPQLEGSLQSWDLSGNISLVDLNITGTSLTGSLPESLCQLLATGDLQLQADCNKVDCCSS